MCGTKLITLRRHSHSRRRYYIIWAKPEAEIYSHRTESCYAITAIANDVAVVDDDEHGLGHGVATRYIRIEFKLGTSTSNTRRTA